jgi:hypothetical protein
MLDVAGRQTDGQMDGWMVLTLTVKRLCHRATLGTKIDSILLCILGRNFPLELHKHKTG